MTDEKKKQSSLQKVPTRKLVASIKRDLKKKIRTAAAKRKLGK